MANILDLSFHELESALTGLGARPYAARQVWQWVHAKGARDFAAMTDLSKDLRARLADAHVIAYPGLAQSRQGRDGTAKLLLEMAGGDLIETVLIPEGNHFTQCLSTQAGCALGCVFCATGAQGFTRNLGHGEIVSQVLSGREYLAAQGETRPVRNLVLMGMGEPLLNFDNVKTALESLRHPLGLDISARRITVSTAGVADRIVTFGRLNLASLAVSLHAPTQELRLQLMPRAAAAWPLDALMAELKAYPLKPRERITFEYILLEGVNDSPENARALVRLLSTVKGKVNLIAGNPSPDLPYTGSCAQAIEAFQKILWDKNMTVTLRKSKGADIAAACGQLRAQRGGDVGRA